MYDYKPAAYTHCHGGKKMIREERGWWGRNIVRAGVASLQLILSWHLSLQPARQLISQTQDDAFWQGRGTWPRKTWVDVQKPRYGREERKRRWYCSTPSFPSPFPPPISRQTLAPCDHQNWKIHTICAVNGQDIAPVWQFAGQNFPRCNVWRVNWCAIKSANHRHLLRLIADDMSILYTQNFNPQLR